MQALFELLLGSIAHLQDLPLEIKHLSGHRMIEIHGNTVLLNLYNPSVDYLTGTVQHRNKITRLQKILAKLAIYLKTVFGNIETMLGLICAITFLRAHLELEAVAGLLAFYLRLKFGDKHMSAVDVIQRLLLSGLVCNFSVYGKFICKNYHFVFLYLHNIKVFFYELKSTSLKTSVGTTLGLQGRASEPTATRLFQRSSILPVITSSLTGKDESGP